MAAFLGEISVAQTIGFIGAGNMASSLIGGMIAKGTAAANIAAFDPNSEGLAQLAAATGICACADNQALIERSDIVVIAVKPQVLKQVLLPLAASLQAKKPLIISIVAGITSASIEQWIGQAAIVRCMPNTPALVQLGASGLVANEQVSSAQRAQAQSVLEAVGIVQWLDSEDQIDAVTAVSGSGPAYFFLLMEAMIEAGEKQGLSREVATQLTLQTALGAATMAINADVDAAELRRRVTSPNGTTQAAIESFEAAGFRAITQAALDAARDRSVELAKELGA